MFQSIKLMKVASTSSQFLPIKNAVVSGCSLTSKRFLGQVPSMNGKKHMLTMANGGEMTRPFATATVDPLGLNTNVRKAPMAKPSRNQMPQAKTMTTPKSMQDQKEPPVLPATFRLKSGQTFKAVSIGAPIQESISGEVVFTTSLVGYPESMSDPSYRGQILVFTQPLIGNYGVPAPDLDEFGLFKNFESDKIHVTGIIMTDYAKKYSHWNAVESLGKWCQRHQIPALSGVDTRAVVTLLREQGSTLGEILIGEAKSKSNEELTDPNKRNLVAEVSVKTEKVYNKGGDVKIALIDCGAKQNIIRCLCKRGAEVHLLPWNHDLTSDSNNYDGVFISNGPGDPSYCDETINNLRKLLIRESAKSVPTPIFGICMGNLLLGKAAGFETYKLPYGNRGHNQPAINMLTKKCVITSQNHGYALKDSDKYMVPGWEKFFVNANDGSNEGIRHKTLPFASVQYHPEAKAGPQDTEYLFDEYLETVRESKRELAQAHANATKSSSIHKKIYQSTNATSSANVARE